MPVILLTRPQAQSEAFAEEIAADGWRSLIWPVIEIRPSLGAFPDLADVDALIFTSARAVEELARLGPPPSLPAWCVGPATAEAARCAGLGPVMEAGGDGDALIGALTAAEGRLLHVRGRDVAVDIASALHARGRDVRDIIAYAAIPGRNPDRMVDAAIATGEVAAVALFSPRSAALFAHAAPIAWRGALKRMTALAISPAAAAPLQELGFERILIATNPNATAMRAELRRIAEGDGAPPVGPQQRR